MHPHYKCLMAPFTLSKPFNPQIQLLYVTNEKLPENIPDSSKFFSVDGLNMIVYIIGVQNKMIIRIGYAIDPTREKSPIFSKNFSNLKLNIVTKLDFLT